MKFARRQFLHLAAGAAALPALSRGAAALDYPTQPVRIVVGFAPGGTTDVVARLIGQYLSERLGQPFIVENRPGAGTNIATEEVLHAKPDGNTLLFVTVTNAINATLFKDISFNFLRDAAPVAGIMQVPNVVVVNPAVPVKTLPEFIAYAKANPGKINMASGGVGIEFAHVRRAVLHDGRHQSGPRALSRRSAGLDRHGDRTDAGDV